MMGHVRSMGLRGLDGYEISVECYITNGLPGFDVVGLPDTAVKEARERVRAAIKNCGYKFPVSRITLNLAPAGTKKTGTLYDLPMLLGILEASGLVKLPKTACAFLGELSLEGSRFTAWRASRRSLRTLRVWPQSNPKSLGSRRQVRRRCRIFAM